MLSGHGYRVDTALNGAAAVQAASAHAYDAILMDCQMPGLNGYEATAAIRAEEGPDRHTPIIAMTAGARREDRERCLAEGMDDYVSKPVDREALLALVGRTVNHAREPDRTSVVGALAIAATAAEGPVPDGPDSPDGHIHRSSTDGGSPVLDAEVIGRLEGLGEAAGEDLMGQLTLLFLADASVLIASMRRALIAHEAGALTRHAHTLSGSSANLGAMELARLCAFMATDDLTGELPETEALLRAIETELELVCAALPLPRSTP
jgi:CheY-like chemotaxis protein